MDFRIYPYWAIVFIFWVIMVNILKSILKRQSASNDLYTYFIQMRLIGYKDHMIQGETASHDIIGLADPGRHWKTTVQRYIGRVVQIQYDVRYEGILFITITSEIKSINVVG